MALDNNGAGCRDQFNCHGIWTNHASTLLSKDDGVLVIRFEERLPIRALPRNQV